MPGGAGLVVRGLTKWYGATRALSGVDLAIPAGRVVALVGHNGAGKSTLLRSLAGAETPDEGTISIDGTAVHLNSPAAATAAGVACVYQELSLIAELTVAQNLFLGTEKQRGPLLRRRDMIREADALCAEYGIEARGADPVRALPVAQRQLLEVARAVNRDARYLLLDEPTTALEHRQVDQLLGVIRRLARERGIGILLIDHKLDEVYAVADHVVGLANGEIVLEGDIGQVRHEDIVEAIVRGSTDAPPDIPSGATPAATPGAAQVGTPPPSADVVLEVRDLRGQGLTGIDLRVRQGEILGVYGLVGSGRSRFLRALYGVQPAPEGTVLLGGAPFRPRGPQHAIAEGIAYVSEERKLDGFVQQMSATGNIVLPVLGHYRRAGLLDWRRLRRAAHAALSRIPIHGDADAAMTTLSGGNQQKALFARALLQSPRLLLLDEPTKGVDVGAKADIHAIIRNLAREGRAVIVVSSEEEELLAIADNVVIFRNGGCDGGATRATELTVSDLRRAAWATA